MSYQTKATNLLVMNSTNLNSYYQKVVRTEFHLDNSDCLQLIAQINKLCKKQKGKNVSLILLYWKLWETIIGKYQVYSQDPGPHFKLPKYPKILLDKNGNLLKNLTGELKTLSLQCHKCYKALKYLQRHCEEHFQESEQEEEEDSEVEIYLDSDDIQNLKQIEEDISKY